MAEKKNKKYILTALGGMVAGMCILLVINYYYEKSSENEACMSCHYHEETDAQWKQSVHYANESGVATECVSCHLPPEGTFKRFTVKAKTGLKDVWSYLTKDKKDIDFDAKKDLEYAVNLVFNESCEKCHVNLFPKGLSDDGVAAHLYFDENREKLDLQCISCHLDVGHFMPGYKHEKMGKAPVDTLGTMFAEATQLTEFKDYVETVPGTKMKISMKAIPGGSFQMGSAKGDDYSEDDEYPQHKVSVSPFYMGEYEVTWDQYWSFYQETMSEGRTEPADVYANNSRSDVDVVSGPTPPFGTPDQGWGMGDRPAITMTHYAAQTFCQWLSIKTGKKYRLPTEAEWEYAARGGTESAYFFEGTPGKYTNEGFWKSIFGIDTTKIASYVVYVNNSKNRTQEPQKVKANPFGLRNMLGNVMEYCSDWYAEDAYAKVHDGAIDPKGPDTGTEHVVRGGSYKDDAVKLRSAARAHTEHDAWLKTDPQNPKSIWWYSDIKGIGFRVVCDVPEGINAK